MRPKIDVLPIGNFVCILIHYKLVLIAFSDNFNCVNTQIRTLIKVLISQDFLHKLSIDYTLVWLYHLWYLSVKLRFISSVHDNFLKLYTEKRQPYTIWWNGVVKSLQEKLKNLNAMEPDRIFSFVYNVYNERVNSWKLETFSILF